MHVRLTERNKSHTIKTPERFVCIGNTSGVFQSRPSLLAQPLIRLSAFKPPLGEDKIEFTRETKMEKREGGRDRGLCGCMCVFSQTRASLTELRGCS